MTRRRIEPVPPSEDALHRMQRILRIAGPVAKNAARLWFSLSIEGRENLPREGPVLLLSNHVTLPDAGLIIVMGKRPIQFMVSQAGMNDSLRARLIAPFGVIPKRKFAADSRAIKLMMRWREVGAAVGLFPEGERPWDGHTLPLITGTEKLVRLLKIPVVTARVINGARVWPRWATGPRKGRIHIEIDPPHSFDRETPLPVIREHVTSRITVDPDQTDDWVVRGRDLAVGLSNVLHACMSCGGIDALEEKGDHLVCRQCAHAWRVDTHNRLHGENGGEDIRIAEAWALLKARFAEGWIADPARFQRDGTILESEPMTLLDVTETEPVVLARGRLRLTEAGLSVDDWVVPFSELKTVSVEFRRRLQFGTDERLFEATIPTESVVKWEWIVKHWQVAVAS
jgi:1-acyl-sn-glycerol-3-phosphate acyltransferase